MFGVAPTGSALDTIVHIIQVSLTPVFLLSGIATLLNVFSTRLARVADRVDAVAEELASADTERAGLLSVQLLHLHRRSVALDIAVVLGALAGAATCGAVLALFVGAVRDTTAASLLFVLFGLAVVCALGAIVAYTVEMLMAGIGIRVEAARGRRGAARPDAAESAEPDSHPDDPPHADAPQSDSP
jgi:Protein of unknown function (DUF2721)